MITQKDLAKKEKAFSISSVFIVFGEIFSANNSLNLTSEVYDSKELKKLKDDDNPLDPINEIHSPAKQFMRAHGGYNRDPSGLYEPDRVHPFSSKGPV